MHDWTMGSPMGKQRATPDTYLQRLLRELDSIRVDYVDVLRASTIVNTDPNRGCHGGVIVVGSPNWGWGPSDPALEADRMGLLRRVRDWSTRFQLLYPHPIPRVTSRLDKNLGLLQRWLLRPRDRSVPSTKEAAIACVEGAVSDLTQLADTLPDDAHPIRVVVDTNTLIDNPDLAVHAATLGPRYLVHLLPVVLRELDDLKRSGRTPDLRDDARRADRRLKALRDNGDVRTGARVSGDVYAVFDYSEPRGDGLPEWLDLSVPDDRLVAATLLLQSEHPGSAVYVATGDLNLQNKLAAVAVPHIELPDDSKP